MSSAPSKNVCGICKTANLSDSESVKLDCCKQVYCRKCLNSYVRVHEDLVCPNCLCDFSPSVLSLSTSNAKASAQNDSCPICHDDLDFENNADECTITSCNHGFCTSCLDNWLAIKATCPLCRARIRDGSEQAMPNNVTTDVSDFIEHQNMTGVGTNSRAQLAADFNITDVDTILNYNEISDDDLTIEPYSIFVDSLSITNDQAVKFRFTSFSEFLDTIIIDTFHTGTLSALVRENNISENQIGEYTNLVALMGLMHDMWTDATFMEKQQLMAMFLNVSPTQALVMMAQAIVSAGVARKRYEDAHGSSYVPTARQQQARDLISENRGNDHNALSSSGNHELITEQHIAAETGMDNVDDSDVDETDADNSDDSDVDEVAEIITTIEQPQPSRISHTTTVRIPVTMTHNVPIRTDYSSQRNRQASWSRWSGSSNSAPMDRQTFGESWFG